MLNQSLRPLRSLDLPTGTEFDSSGRGSATRFSEVQDSI
jgi:hypothetical protein